MPTLVRLRLMPLDDRIVPAGGYFRLAEYNIASSTSSPASGLNTIIQGIGDEHVNGVTQPIDLLALQEVQSQATTSQAVVNLMNGLYGAGIYQHGSLDGGTSGSGTQGIVYNHLTLQLLSETAVGTVSSSGLARQVLRYKMHPVGYGSSGDFYVYVSHYKADNTTTDEGRRLAEATAIRADSDALGQGAKFSTSATSTCIPAPKPAIKGCSRLGTAKRSIRSIGPARGTAMGIFCPCSRRHRPSVRPTGSRVADWTIASIFNCKAAS